MNFPIVAPEFAGQNVELRTSTWLGSKVYVDGQPATREGRTYRIPSATGKPALLRLKVRFPDPVPNVEINGRIVELAPALPWYVWAWAGLPLVLIVMGGAVGGALGAAATFSSAQLFRGTRSTTTKYLLSGFYTVAAAVAYVVVASLLRTAIRR